MMANKKVHCTYWSADGVRSEQLTMREVVSLRNRLREAAFGYLKEHADDPKCQHIVYYRDRRDADDAVWQVHFYCAMRPWTDDEFYRETENLDGFVGAVHRHN